MVQPINVAKILTVYPEDHRDCFCVECTAMTEREMAAYVKVYEAALKEGKRTT